MTRSMSNDPDGVRAMRSLRARRSGLLRTEPKGVSARWEPAAIALFWLLLFGLAVVL